MAEKKIVTGKILKTISLAKDVFQLQVQIPEVASQAKPGQFVNVYMEDASMLLPRPISIGDADEEVLTLVYGVVGKGTKALSERRDGETIRISTPMGNGYQLSALKRGDRAVVVGGGIGVPPLLKLTRVLSERGVEVTAVLGFKEEPFLLRELEEAGANLWIATDSGSVGFHGNVVQLIEKEGINGQAWFACGPKIMLKFLTNYVSSLGCEVQVSMEERMGCGFGACVGCVCKVKTKGQAQPIQKKVCKDGPVFLGSEVFFDD